MLCCRRLSVSQAGCIICQKQQTYTQDMDLFSREFHFIQATVGSERLTWSKNDFNALPNYNCLSPEIFFYLFLAGKLFQKSSHQGFSAVEFGRQPIVSFLTTVAIFILSDSFSSVSSLMTTASFNLNNNP